MRNPSSRCVAVAALLVSAAAFAGNDDCVIYDDFSDGSFGPLWERERTDSSILNIREQNGRVEFPANNANPGIEVIAAGRSRNWKVDMTSDWAVSGKWHIDPAAPTFGDVGMSFVLMMEGDFKSLFVRDGFTLNAGVANIGQGVVFYESTRLYNNGSFTTPTNFDRTYTNGTVYIYYDASTGCIRYNDEPGFSGSVQICGVGSVSNEDEAWVGFLAYSFGSVPTFGGNRLRCDDFCLIYGNVVGASAGACCLDGGCVQTVSSQCAGDWQGAGSVCGAVDCGPDGACCLDDDCVVMTEQMCSAGAGEWQGVDTTCAAVDCGPDGACCVGVDDCLVATELACASSAGAWQGAGSECGSADCGPDGACCFGDDDCAVVTEQTCAAGAGAWYGAGTPCSAPLCAPPVCVADLDGDGTVGFPDLLALLFSWGECARDVHLIEPAAVPYLCGTDGPWALTGDDFHYAWLEDFEDGALNTPGLGVSAGVVNGPGANTDSIDCDGNGIVDGAGTGGSSYFVQDPDGASVMFTFDVEILAKLPTRAGLVWTDGNDAATITFEAFDGDGAPIDSFQAALGDGVHDGSTAADRFLGVEAACGISAIQMSASVGSVELDHVQFGYEPVCVGDLDADCEVGFSDLLELLFWWGACR